MHALRFPVGEFQMPQQSTAADRLQWIAEIEAVPSLLHALLAGTYPAQLENPYRPGGWTGRQVVHHMADSHMNAYVRARLALTEEAPVIKPYAEDRWAELVDARGSDVNASVAILEGLHQRWGILLHALSDEEWLRTYQHPEMGAVRLDQQTALYAWHGRHHLGHLKAALGR